MDGNDVLSQFNFFTEASKKYGIVLYKFNYDGSVFGNYDVIYRLKKTEIKFNNDRNFMSVTISAGKNQHHDYFVLLSKKLGIPLYDCNKLPESERLLEVIRRVLDTLIDLLNSL